MAEKEIVEIEFKGKGDLLEQVKKLDRAMQSLVKAQVSLSKGTNAVNNANKKTIRSKQNLNKATKSLVRNNRNLSGSLSVLRSNLLIYNFLMGLGIKQTLDMVKAGAKFTSLATAFNTLTKSTTDTFTNLNKLRQATNNTVSDTDLLTQANNALILGVTNNTDEMAKMFDMAQRLGRALGRDTASSVESLITGIGRQSRLMLDNIGIIVKSEEAYEAYAKANNKLAKDLTDSEKKQAFFNATMESAERKISLLGVEVLNSQDTFDQFTTKLSNLAVIVGNKVTPAVLEVAGAFSDFFVKVKDFILSLDETPLETTIRELQELGVASESLKDLQKINLQQQIISLNTQLDVTNKRFKNIKQTEDELLKQNKTILNSSDERIKNELNLIDLEKQKTSLTFALNRAMRSQSTQVQFDQNINIQKHRQDLINVQLKINSAKKNIKMSESEINLAQKQSQELAKNLTLLTKKAELETQLLNIDKTKTDDPTTKDGAVTVTPTIDEKALKEIESLRRTVLGKSFDFQMKQLDLLEKQFNEKVGATVDSEQYFADQRDKIRQEDTEKTLALAEEALGGTAELFQKQEDARKLIRNDAMQDQLDDLTTLQGELEAILGHEIDVTAYIEEEKKKVRDEFAQKRKDQEMEFVQLQLDNIGKLVQASDQLLDQANKNIQQKKENQIKALKTTDRFENASATQRENMENAIRENFAEEEQRLFAFKKMSAIANATINLAEQITKYAGNPIQTAFIAGVGALQMGAIMAQQPPKYATGGLVGGQRHSQGGTLIEAEQGEFVMSRQAVQSAGLEAMNEINQGNTGGTNITLNISAPLVDETVVDQIIPAINTALSEGKSKLALRAVGLHPTSLIQG